MLLVDEQHPARHDPAGKAGPEALPIDLLLAFTRAMVQMTVNHDVLYLAVLQAAKETGCGHEEAERLIVAALKEHKAASVWPKGF